MLVQQLFNVNLVFFIFCFCFSSQVQRLVTTRTALSWFSPSRRNCYNDDLSEPANVGCNDDDEDNDVVEITAKNKDGRVNCSLTAVKFFFPTSQIQGLRVPANSLQQGEIKIFLIHYLHPPDLRSVRKKTFFLGDRLLSCSLDYGCVMAKPLKGVIFIFTE